MDSVCILGLAALLVLAIVLAVVVSVWGVRWVRGWKRRAPQRRIQQIGRSARAEATQVVRDFLNGQGFS